MVGVLCAALPLSGWTQTAMPAQLVRHERDETDTAHAPIDQQSRLGMARLKLDAASTLGAQRNRQIDVDRAWSDETNLRLRLSTFLSPAREPTVLEKKTGVPIASPEYEDRLIDTGNLLPLADETADFTYNADGQPRSWRFEGFGSNINTGGTSRHESGFRFGGRYDTMDYGALSLDGTFREGSNSGLFTAWQRGLAFDNDWRANNGAGMLNTPAIELSRGQYRVYLPTFPIAGVQTEWLHDGDLQLQASVGEPGTFNGLRLAGFSRLGGNLFTGGAQWIVAPQWQVGFQFADVQGVGGSLDATAPDAKISGRSWYGSTAWHDGNSRLQFNLVDSEIGQGSHKNGIWFDGETRDGRYRHNYGLFKLEPGIVWGYLPFIEDSQGGYYRINYQSQQWLWTGGLDSVSSVSGRGADGIYGTASVRYQVNRSLGVGGGGTVRHARDEAEAAYVFIDKQSRLGTTRLQIDVASASGAQLSKQITLDQAWPVETGLRLSSSLSLARETTSDKRVTRANLGINGGVDLSNNLSLEGNVHWLAARDSGITRGTYANVSLNWRINSRWSMSMSYYDNRREDPPVLSVASLIPAQLIAPVVKDRAMFLILRYEDRAGTPVAPLGGAPGSGAGNIVGYLFLDANNNEKLDANETGAANVTILLDGRFSTRTDNQGRFEFPLVAAGTHAISIIPDNLPLPYFIGGDEKRQVIVRTRETTTLDIPASKRQ